MRKWIIAACLLLGFSISSRAEKIKVVATASIFADMAAEIGGELIEVSSIVPVGGDPHMYDPIPSDVSLVNSADVILMNGLTFEGWLRELIDNAGTKAPTVLITAGVKVIESLTYQNSSDPHAWMDLQNGLIYIKNIKDALIKADPDNAAAYEFNYKAYRQQLENLDQYIMDRINEVPSDKRILITSHDAFQYYGQRYGVQLEAIQGISTDADVQTSDMLRISEVIRASGVPAVFVESTVNPKLLEQIATDNNVQVGGKLFSDSVGDQDSDAPTYYDMLKYNTDTIVEALKAEVTPVATNESSSSLWIVFLLTGGVALAALFVFIGRMNA